MPESVDEFVQRVGMVTDPVADPAAVVTAGRARFTVLTDRLLRLEWSATGSFEDRGSYAFPVRRGPVPSFTSSVAENVTVIDTGALRLEYADRGEGFSPDNLSITVTGLGVTWTPGLRDRWNLGGARRTVDNCRGAASLEPGLVSRSGWALYDDGPSLLFDDRGWAVGRPADAGIDWYFFGHGHDYPAAVREYQQFGGGVPLLPRWLLGSWWSRYWAYRDQDLRALVSEFADRQIPLDVLVIDMDWHLTDSWTGYTWNRELFPDPAAFLAWLHDRGLHDTLNLHPALGVQSFEEAYPRFAEAMGRPADGKPVPFQVDNPRYMANYFSLLHHPLEHQGVDFWWMDWQQGRTFADSTVDPLPWLNHLHFVDLGRHPDSRSLTFSRWGGLGSHRYPIGFSGDSFARWDALRFQPRYTAAGANVGYGWWSHDIGGHVGADEPELYLRWVQFGAFSPILRLHSNQDPASDRRPWAFGEQILDAVRAAYDERYRLLPYLYTVGRIAADTGVAPVRPLSWVDPSADSAYASRFSYLLGPDLLVAPALSPTDPATGLTRVDVWLPAGEWVERTTLERVTGPTWTRQLADLDRIPQFVRLGTVLPLAEVALTTGAQPSDRLTFSVFPGAAGSTRVYDDDGTTLAYRSGAFSWTSVTVQAPSDTSCVVTIDTPVEREYTVRLEGVAGPVSATVAGEAVPTRAVDRATVVELGRRSGRIELTVAGSDPLVGYGAKLNAELVAADVARLVGDTPIAAVPTDHPGRADAIARLGGPALQVHEHTAPDEAALVLGRLIVGTGAGAPVRVSGRWTLHRGAETESAELPEQSVPDGGLVVDAPWNWDDSRTPSRWTLDVVADWDSVYGPLSVRESFVSQVLSGWITSWAVAVAEPTVTEPGVRDWLLYEAEPFDLDFTELTQRFEVPDERSPAPLTDVVVHGRTRLTAAADCRVAFEYFSSSPELTILVDGHPVDIDVSGGAASLHYDLNPAPRRSAAFDLSAGEHDVVFRCPKSADLPWYQFTLAATVVDAGTNEVRLDVSSDASRLIARF